MTRVLITMPIADAGLQLLTAGGYELDLVERPTAEQFRGRLARADAVVLRFQSLTQHDIEAAPRLQFVARHGVGYDAVDVDALTARGIPLAITPSANATGVAEHAMALLLAAARRIVAHDAGVRDGQWQGALRGPMIELSGKTALVVGAGRIGSATATLMRAFGMTVWAYDPQLPDGATLAPGVQRANTLDDVLRLADVVSLHVPLNPTTRHLVDPLAMKPGALLINTARGGLLDPVRLLAALDTGVLAGAGLDVFATEPPDVADPLLHHPLVVCSPHAASLTDASIERMGIECAQNIMAFFSGRPLTQNFVNSLP